MFIQQYGHLFVIAPIAVLLIWLLYRLYLEAIEKYFELQKDQERLSEIDRFNRMQEALDGDLRKVLSENDEIELVRIRPRL